MMTIQRNQVVVVDVESTCWEHEKAPPGEISEIIEIGVCTLHIPSGQPDNKRSIFVKPTMSKISPFCTGLTTITPEMVKANGISFEDACTLLEKDYQTQSRLWVSWGNYDRTMFLNQGERMGIDYPFSDHHCNLKNLFAKFYGKRMGMAQALDTIDLKLEGTHHRGGDDAWNIARILTYLLEKHGRDLLERFYDGR
jgi:inhibitor of KinA sporulation pathway (predicted exonuclease)